jgi:hypothetical protein
MRRVGRKYIYIDGTLRQYNVYVNDSIDWLFKDNEVKDDTYYIKYKGEWRSINKQWNCSYWVLSGVLS